MYSIPSPADDWSPSVPGRAISGERRFRFWRKQPARVAARGGTARTYLTQNKVALELSTVDYHLVCKGSFTLRDETI